MPEFQDVHFNIHDRETVRTTGIAAANQYLPRLPLEGGRKHPGNPRDVYFHGRQASIPWVSRPWEDLERCPPGDQDIADALLKFSLADGAHAEA